MDETGDVIKLPSGSIIKLKTLTGEDWYKCVAYSTEKAAKEGKHLMDLAYWERYEELITGWARVKLNSLEFNDARSLRLQLVERSVTSPKGPNESNKNLKN